MGENEVGDVILGAAMKVHSALGPGLLESAYEVCLAHEIGKHKLAVTRQLALPISYDGIQLDTGYRLDLLVDDCVIVEFKGHRKICADSYCPGIELFEIERPQARLLT